MAARAGRYSNFALIFGAFTALYRRAAIGRPYIDFR